MSVQAVKTKPILIGLTGGIGSGKTAASNYFQSLGIPVIDSDLIVKRLWKENKEMVQKIEKSFGFPIENDLDRKKLAKIIFNDQEKREILNEIVHPYVFQEVEKEKSFYTDRELIVIDMPLLIEVGYRSKVDFVLVVYVSKETQINRLIQRDDLSIEEATKRIKAQMPLDEKRAFADVILNNETTICDLYYQIDSFLRGLKDEK
ncbi:MAG: dephospho-CoA kinase [Tenericutes bacterium HGW-Tenericutes-2]|jgi:dephospho-CoA kinase|nr:MAG: dephospho-CoA kinase [Tenericutes bacterium HGW-Tenericutes-2]